jgi:hypothetical protein
MWFGAPPKRSRAAAQERVLSDAERVALRQQEIRDQIRGFIREDELRNEKLANQIDDMVEVHQQAQLATPPSFSAFHVPHAPATTTARGVAAAAATSTLPRVTFAMSHSDLASPALHPTHSRPQQQQQQRAVAAESSMMSSMISVRRRGGASLARLNVEILRSCSTVVRGIDKIMELRDRATELVQKDISATELDLPPILPGGGRRSSVQVQPSMRSQQQQQQQQQQITSETDGSEDKTSSFAATHSRIAMKRDAVVSALDAEELEEDLRRLRRICFEDAYLDDEVVSADGDGADGGYSADPPLANLGPVSSVVGSVEDMRASCDKALAAAAAMRDALENCISLRRDPMLLRKFKRSLIRGNYHARKVLSWANQCRTHMFIFNNTINQVTRDAADDLRRTEANKEKARQRIELLKQQHVDVDAAITDACAEVDRLSEEHAELQVQCQAAFADLIAQKRAAAPAAAVSAPFGESVFTATSTAAGLFANLDATLSAAQAIASSSKKKDPRLDTAAHHALDRMSVTAVEMYLLLDRYANAVADPKLVPSGAKNAVQRLLATIEQSVAK